MKFLRASALTMGAVMALHASAATIAYDVKDLGTRPGRAALPVAINASGQVAGQALDWDSGDLGSFATGPQGEGMNDPCPAGTLSCLAAGIDDAGQVALSITNQKPNGDAVQRSAFASVDGAGLTYFGNLGVNFSNVEGMSAKGLVTGDALDAGNVVRAFLGRAPGKHLTPLGTLAGGTHGVAVNDAGIAVGWALFEGNTHHAVLMRANGDPAKDLGTLPGGTIATCTAISSNGYIVGRSNVAGGTTHAFSARVGVPGLTDLGEMGGGYADPKGVNRAGTVVGGAALPSGEGVGFVMQLSDGRMVDLNTLVQMPAGVTLVEADAINEQGQIAAYGSDFHTYLLTPR